MSEVKAIQFINWSNEDFTWKWDGVEYTFKSLQATYLPDWQAQHFAKHLTDREMTRVSLQVNDFRRDQYLAKCFTTQAPIVAEDNQKLQMEAMNAPVEMPKEPIGSQLPPVSETPKKRMGRPPKKVEAEPEEFAGLKES